MNPRRLRKATIAAITLQKKIKGDVIGIEIRVGERLRPPAAAHDLAVPGGSAAGTKTPRSHALCRWAHSECEGLGNISHHVYTKLHSDRVIIRDRTCKKPSHRLPPTPQDLKGSVPSNYKNRGTV